MGFIQLMERVIGTTFTSKPVTQKLGVVSFGYGSERRYDKKPHELMRDALNAYESRPFVHSGVNQLALLITGGHLSVSGSEKADVDKIQKWIDYRKHIHEEVNLLTKLFLVTGNVPVEKAFVMKNEKFYVDDFYVFPRPDRFFRTLYVYDKDGNYVDDDNKYWLIEVDKASRGLLVDGKSMNPQMFRIAYSPYAIAPVEVIYAIPFHKDKFCYLRTSYKKWFFYSYSFVMSSLDDIDAMYNIIQNIIGISKYKAIGKQIINIGDEKDPASPEDINNLQADLQAGTFKNIVLNKKVNKTSLSYEGDYNTMIGEMDFLRKEVGSGLTPNYLTPWNSEVNRSTSSETKIVLDKQLEVWRRGILEFLNDNILKSVKDMLGITSDVEFVFAEVDLYTPEEKQAVISPMYQDNLITANEYRSKMGLDTIEGGDVFKTEFEKSLGVLDKDYDPTEGLKLKEEIKKQARVGGHVVSLEKNGHTWQVLDGSEIKLSIDDDEETARTFMKNYIQRIKDNETPLTETDYKNEEEEMSKELSSTVKNLKDEVSSLLSSHTETFKEGKLINTDIIPKIDDLFDKAFSGLRNKFRKTVGDVFDSSKTGVLSAITAATLGTGKQKPDISKIQNIDMKDLKLDAVEKTYQQDLKNLKNQKVAQLSRMVADAAATGVSSGKIKTQVLQSVGDVHHEAERILRTNINRTSTMSKLLMYQKMNIKKFQWVAHIDERTRKTHKKRNGKVFSVDRALKGLDPAPTMIRDTSGKWIPSENINCRCTIRPYFT